MYLLLAYDLFEYFDNYKIKNEKQHFIDNKGIHN